MHDMKTATVPAWTLGWRLRRAFEGQMSREEMARRIGYDVSTVSRWVKDKGVPRPSVIRDWAAICDVPEEWLLYGTGSHEEPIRDLRDRHERDLDAKLDKWEGTERGE